jgi:hypothetical protein
VLLEVSRYSECSLEHDDSLLVELKILKYVTHLDQKVGDEDSVLSFGEYLMYRVKAAQLLVHLAEE